jgi:hypothetical protein
MKLSRLLFLFCHETKKIVTGVSFSVHVTKCPGKSSEMSGEIVKVVGQLNASPVLFLVIPVLTVSLVFQLSVPQTRVTPHLPGYFLSLKSQGS